MKYERIRPTLHGLIPDLVSERFGENPDVMIYQYAGNRGYYQGPIIPGSDPQIVIASQNQGETQVMQDVGYEHRGVCVGTMFNGSYHLAVAEIVPGFSLSALHDFEADLSRQGLSRSSEYPIGLESYGQCIT